MLEPEFEGNPCVCDKFYWSVKRSVGWWVDAEALFGF